MKYRLKYTENKANGEPETKRLVVIAKNKINAKIKLITMYPKAYNIIKIK